MDRLWIGSLKPFVFSMGRYEYDGFSYGWMVQLIGEKLGFFWWWFLAGETGETMELWHETCPVEIHWLFLMIYRYWWWFEWLCLMIYDEWLFDLNRSTLDFFGDERKTHHIWLMPIYVYIYIYTFCSLHLKSWWSQLRFGWSHFDGLNPCNHQFPPSKLP